MATLNKASLRTEFDALKARFESLCAKGKMSPESRALFDALLMLFELLMAVFMEKHTPKSPANSGLPPSQSPNDATARSRPGAKGKGPSYNEARCANTRTREHVRVLGVDCCARCGEDLTDTACTGHERRTLGGSPCRRNRCRRRGEPPRFHRSLCEPTHGEEGIAPVRVVVAVRGPVLGIVRPGGTGRSIEHDQPGEPIGAELIDVGKRRQGPPGPAAEHDAIQIQAFDERTEISSVLSVVVAAGGPGALAMARGS